MNPAGLQADPWLAGLTARPAFRLLARQADQSLPDLSRLPAGSFVYAKLPAGELIQARELQALGFYLTDTSLQFAKPCSEHSDSLTQAQPDIQNIQRIQTRWAQRDNSRDQDAVRQIAGQSFRYSRFHQDPYFSRALADRIKSEWAGNFFNDQRGDELALIEADDQIAGFSLMLSRPEGWIIDLIAVSPDFQRRGLGRSLLAFLEQEALAKQHQRLRVGTQALNTPSVNLYENRGFRLEHAEYVFHYVHQGRSAV